MEDSSHNENIIGAKAGRGYSGKLVQFGVRSKHSYRPKAAVMAENG